MLPPVALEWLVGSERATVLLVGGAGGYASILSRAGHSVTVVDPSLDILRKVAMLTPGAHVIAGMPESLPFDPSCFDVVLAVQNFHTFAPGLALGEWARVLKPHGRVALAYLTRDDSVPWVSKLKRIVQFYIPNAMSSDYGSYSASALSSAAYYTAVEKVSFRLWVPSTRTQLQEAACQTPGAEDLDEDRRTRMLEEIAELYDLYARIPDPLQLPYQIQCWRAQVDQSTLTTPLIPGNEGLTFSL